MADRFRLTLAQLNPTVGDLEGNAALALDAWQQGREAGVAVGRRRGGLAVSVSSGGDGVPQPGWQA